MPSSSTVPCSFTILLLIDCSRVRRTRRHGRVDRGLAGYASYSFGQRRERKLRLGSRVAEREVVLREARGMMRWVSEGRREVVGGAAKV